MFDRSLIESLLGRRPAQPQTTSPQDFARSPDKTGPMGKKKITMEQLAAALARVKEPRGPSAPSPRQPSGINQGTFARRDNFDPQGTKYGAALMQILMGRR